jgi:hypothetical protein
LDNAPLCNRSRNGADWQTQPAAVNALR